MANSADPDLLASSEANWSGSTLFSKAGHIWVQQDKGKWMQLNVLLFVQFTRAPIQYTIPFQCYLSLV